jgi:ubiquitin-activating enzyme E1
MSVEWGEWMGGWKVGESEGGDESERIDRQKAAFGAETLAKLKDINVLIVGLRGVGVESAKNLILSNVGSVVVWDPEPTTPRDRGSNFYLTEQHVTDGTPRGEGSLSQLSSLNPFCKVKSYSGELDEAYLTQADVAGTGKPFTAVIVSRLLPKAELFRINAVCRAHNCVFLLAVTNGVTASIFSDFGPAHRITDSNGEPTETYAVANVEVMEKHPILKVSGVEDGAQIVVVSFASDVATTDGLADGDTIELDDFSGPLAGLQGKQFKVKRAAFLSPKAAEVKVKDPAFLLQLSNGTVACVEGWQKQHDSYKAEFEAAGTFADKEEFEKKWKNSQLREITLLNRLVLEVSAEDAAAFSQYASGGLASPVKEVIEKSYASLEESLVSAKSPHGAPGVPDMLDKEAAQERGAGIDIHLALSATLDFQEANGRWPALHSEEDAAAVVEAASAASARNKEVEGGVWLQSISWGFPTGEDRPVDAKRVGRFAKLFGTEITGFAAYLGGAIAQEVIKKTGKFTPIDGWMHHEDHSLIQTEEGAAPAACEGTRYDDYISVMGAEFMARAADQRVFLVGAGALGCEYLKGLSLMGVATGPKGKILVTDMDTIETSNLSRQFLFRDSDVGSSKSKSGARVVKEWNPDMNIEGVEKFVGPTTEDYFSDEFWEGLDLCWNALDNVLARKYTDKRCLWYGKPLLESGTTGTKSNHEVILPHKTGSYNDGVDPPEVGIAMCTLRSFPYLPLHCIEFAKQKLFTEHYVFAPEQYERFRSDMGDFFEQLGAMSTENERLSAMRSVMKIIELQKSGAIDYDGCIRLAFERLIADFRNDILDVIDDGDAQEESGKPFWTGTKRRPNPVDFSPDDKLSMEYLYAASNLFAHVFGVEQVRDRGEFDGKVRAMSLAQPEWSKGSRIKEAEPGQEEEEGEDAVDEEELARLEGELYGVDPSGLLQCKPHDFEKDDDDNYHIDFLTIASNLRAWNYNSKETPRHAVKVTAGRIIPALATTTAMVCGLVDIEYCKLVLGLHTKEKGEELFLNSNINLGTGSEAFSAFRPEKPIAIKSGLAEPETFNSWDKIELVGDRSVQEVVTELETKYKCTVQTLYDPQVPLDKAPNGIYSKADRAKLDWAIKLTDDGKLECPDECYAAWPQLRMAGQMLKQLPAESGQRKMFEGQVNTAATSLAKTKETFKAKLDGAVSAAHSGTYRPLYAEDEEKLAYFDAIAAARPYVTLQANYSTEEGEEVLLPPIKIVIK